MHGDYFTFTFGAREFVTIVTKSAIGLHLHRVESSVNLYAFFSYIHFNIILIYSLAS